MKQCDKCFSAIMQPIDVVDKYFVAIIQPTTFA